MLDTETITVLALRLLGGTRAEDVVAWANAELVAGYDTPQLRMLASSGPPYYWSEVDVSFELALEELGITAPEPPILLRQFARLVAQRLLDDQIDAVYACHVLFHIYEGLDSPDDLQIWYELDDAWYDIVHGYESYRRPPITRDNFADFVKEEARLLLERDGTDPTLGSKVQFPGALS